MSLSGNSIPWRDRYIIPVLWSFFEVLFTIIVSNLAIIFGIFVHQLLQDKTAPMGDVFLLHLNNLQYKDLIVFVFGIAAPSIWILGRNQRLWRHYKFCAILFGLQCGVVISVGMIYALSLAGVVKNVDLAEYWARYCFFGAVFMWFLTLCYQKIVLDKSSDGISAPNNAGQSAANLLDSLRSRA